MSSVPIPAAGPFASARSELAVREDKGTTLRDGDDSTWTDPYLRGMRDCNTALAPEAARAGFDEIQWIKRPLSGQASRAGFFNKLLGRRLRPWLQAFIDYAFDRRGFDRPVILIQIRAVEGG